MQLVLLPPEQRLWWMDGDHPQAEARWAQVGNKKVQREHEGHPPERIVKVTWLDASYEFETGTLGGPGVCVTVGFELPPRWHAHESFAAERTPEGFRAITHIPSVNIVDKKEL